MDILYWEDFRTGDVQTFGEHLVTEAEIIEFGREFDPQPFHIDPEAAAQSPYGGLIASGWQSAAFFMRMLVDGVLSKSASMGSPGVETLRWKRPVRAGDTLSARTTVLESRVMESRPAIGLVKNRFEVLNQNETVVLDMVSYGMFSRRPDTQPGEGAA